MRNIIKLLRTAGIAAIFALVATLPAAAQRGEKTLGIAGGFASYNNGGKASVFFQYSFSQRVRLAPEIGYVFRNEGKSGFIIDVDVHIPFRLAKGIGIYPLVGLAFNDWSYVGDGHNSRVGFNFGGGLDFYMTSTLKLNVQGKYSAMNDTGGGFIQMGIGYVF